MNQTDAVNAHYGTDDLIGRVSDALRASGLEAPVPLSALASLDQFHVGGDAATADLAAMLDIGVGCSLLDVGCGLGGPARYLAAQFGCSVTGIDLNKYYVELANMLSEMAGLSDQVRCVVGDASQLPFAARSFDFAWTQHVGMNIADREAFYAGISNVLRPGGRLAIYDVVAGAAGPMQYPVPWARNPAASFVLSAQATRGALEGAGFKICHWRDATATAMGWQQEQVAASLNRPAALRKLSLPLVMGPDFLAMAANLGRNLQERRAALLQAVVQRPS